MVNVRMSSEISKIRPVCGELGAKKGFNLGIGNLNIFIENLVANNI